ncbi:hypothetical protein GCM10010112_80450 [Actinoplanes lobatus]|uniref:Uncharacterized protein n=1 Tax=Actinoplanes lobatus TaxID=113568 RepID=A0A7W7MKS3_9ACTN|nr:hypothetical protein [Actinoplanes lobatus]MBB4753994.1 hypothetical protein [Actinoplanes lobatus]GGN92853.1 hypothetical protein GCM10010112_80450 [Actinoplanes lobatus]GIE44042.1 hypothetical protein Alo02nite_69400 [Actinoplanes lobatus]
MTQMTFPMTFPATHRPAAAPAPASRWRLLGAEFATALVVNLGARPETDQTRSRYADRGTLVAPARPGAERFT